MTSDWSQIPVKGHKLRLALDTDSDDIIAHVMKDQLGGDASQVKPLLDKINMPVCQFTADGVHGDVPTYDAVSEHALILRWLSRCVPVHRQAAVWKAYPPGTLKIGVTVGYSPLFSISVSYEAKFGGIPRPTKVSSRLANLQVASQDAALPCSQISRIDASE